MVKDLLKALKLEPGGVYAIEIQKHMPHDQRVALQESMKPIADEIGCKFVMLGPNLKIARDDRKVVPC